MLTLLTIVHIVICLALMAVILLQSGKGGNVAGAFGVGGGSQTLFGGRGASTFLTKGTMWLGIVFFVTSLTLSLLSRANSQGPESLIQREARARGVTSAPAVTPIKAPAGQPTPTPTPATPAKGGK